MSGDDGRERVLGLGGVFLRGPDPAALSRWYADVLGLASDEHGMWLPGNEPAVVAAFDADTDYLGARDQRVMLNFRVRDLDAMLAQVRAAGGVVDDKTQEMEGVGRFGWVTDPAGNRIELWQVS
jgi:predicted enzyme related to lactoylglutathione lyase